MKRARVLLLSSFGLLTSLSLALSTGACGDLVQTADLPSLGQAQSGKGGSGGGAGGSSSGKGGSGTTTNTCDPKPDATMLPALDGPCYPKADAGCGVPNSACIAKFDTRGNKRKTLRLSQLRVESPKVLASQIVQSTIVTAAVSYDQKACFLHSPSADKAGLFNWIMVVDTEKNVVKTGGAKPVADPNAGYSFFTGDFGGLAVGPVEVAINYDAATGAFSTKDKLSTLNVPIFQDIDAAKPPIVLPLRNGRIENAALSEDGNCIGRFKGKMGELDETTDCEPLTAKVTSDDAYQYESGGTIAGEMTVEETDKVLVVDLMSTLCTFLFAKNVVMGPDGYKHCGRKADGKIDTGDSTDVKVDDKGEAYVELVAKFAAAGIRINDECMDVTTGGGSGACQNLARGDMLPALDGACYPKADAGCGVANSSCIAKQDNRGQKRKQLRMSQLRVKSPKVLASQIVQSTIVTAAVSYDQKACFLHSPSADKAGLFNWIMVVDTEKNLLKTGGAKPVVDPNTGYSFFTGDFGGLAVGPVEVAINYDAATGAFSTKDKLATLNVPIFQDLDGAKPPIVLPLRNGRIENAALSEDGNCIGRFKGKTGELDETTDCEPLTAKVTSDDAYQYESGGTIAGEMTIEETDKVLVVDLMSTLCTFLFAQNVVMGPDGYKHCGRGADGKIDTGGSADVKVDDKGEAYVELVADFAAAGVPIVDECK